MEKYSTHAERINWKKQARVILSKRLVLELPFVKDYKLPEAWVSHPYNRKPYRVGHTTQPSLGVLETVYPSGESVLLVRDLSKQSHRQRHECVRLDDNHTRAEGICPKGEPTIRGQREYTQRVNQPYKGRGNISKGGTKQDLGGKGQFRRFTRTAAVPGPPDPPLSSFSPPPHPLSTQHKVLTPETRALTVIGPEE
eukprot:1188935-Prorocentrum_minimum.AAC.3